ncbi:SDR family oxidoreductase [Candidatus Parcubacteria bacterium]|nr:MAG: SDR family oxidoreductase [Candidatus Parcubacteria bacterium]
MALNKKLDRDFIANLFSLQGMTAIITGGAGRLGVQYVTALKKAGANVVSFDVVINNALGKNIQQEKVDITKKDDVFRATDIVEQKYGSVDILINNAAFNPKVGKDADSTGSECWLPHEDYPQSLWLKEFDIGLNGAMYCTQASARHMIRQNSGIILNIASTSAITAPDHRKYEKGKFKSAAYPVVKTALLGLTRSWAAYFASTAPNVRVNSVCLGAVNFGSMEPEFLAKLGQRNMLGRPAKPDEYNGLILFLCSDASSFITGSIVTADGGQTVW